MRKYLTALVATAAFMVPSPAAFADDTAEHGADQIDNSECPDADDDQDADGDCTEEDDEGDSDGDGESGGDGGSPSVAEFSLRVGDDSDILCRIYADGSVFCYTQNGILPTSLIPDPWSVIPSPWSLVPGL